MAQSYALANQQVYLYLNTPLYNGRYQAGQYVSFFNLSAAEAFLQDAPECVQIGSSQYIYGYLVYQVWPSSGCAIPPVPVPPPCPCANNYNNYNQYQYQYPLY